eukprot:scaffold190_cov171-Amphora_coffeaeformis.AAC.18
MASIYMPKRQVSFWAHSEVTSRHGHVHSLSPVHNYPWRGGRAPKLTSALALAHPYFLNPNPSSPALYQNRRSSQHEEGHNAGPTNESKAIVFLRQPDRRSPP